ncbi:hypothetical protein L0668_18850 [Paraglaciecola aquimarina]|uniref:Uncharacterized protein n=1 Tax=Paraglaciecola algarum TaxID=3050085 RepID=A0ABS9DB35_9ALTE|nr:hypothetical protein [Paraglaciecola sp. G1-23]MCF2950178.1 hypothetical protein [Paraglaciecola sp. G1-23]
MQELPIRITTISPIYSPLSLSTGINHSSDTFFELLNQLTKNNAYSKRIHSEKKLQDYLSIAKDNRENRLMLWQDSENPDLKIHVFPNNVAVVEIALTLDSNLSTNELMKQCRLTTNNLISQCYSRFIQSLQESISKLQSQRIKLSSEHIDSPYIYWTTRAMLLTKEELQLSPKQILIKSWLKDTRRSADADDIISGSKNYSLTWLNYVLIDPATEDEDPRLSTMVLAQYFYTAQENCNNQLKQAIDGAYNSKKYSETNKKLASSRVLARLLQVEYHEHINYLNPFKRNLLNEILSGWEFTSLNANGQRMIEVCSSRLQEEDNKRRERSTVMTDLLLVTLSFFTVFELSLYLTEFSREMMSRPALDYNDDKTSFFLQFIANVDADIMFGFGFILTLLLVILYKFIKAK